MHYLLIQFLLLPCTELGSQGTTKLLSWFMAGALAGVSVSMSRQTRSSVFVLKQNKIIYTTTVCELSSFPLLPPRSHCQSTEEAITESFHIGIKSNGGSANRSVQGT